MIKPPILLNNGLVTSKQASLLAEGELTRADDSRYRADDPALHRAWGRTQYISGGGQIGGASGKVVGLVYCPFEPNAEGPSDAFLVAHQSNKYYTSVFAARTGTISGTTIDNVGTGTHLDTCHGFNRYFLFNGNTDGIQNIVLKPGTTNPVSRTHGLIPASSPTVTTAAGSWPKDDAFWGEGRFFFIATEVVNPGGTDELESAANTTSPPFADLQKDGSGNINFNVIITRPATLNNSNPVPTEIRIYMAKASLNQAWDNSLLARAFRVGTITPSATPANDKLTLSANYTFYDPTTPPTCTVVSGSMTNPNNMQADDNIFATVASGNAATVDLTNWGFAVPGATAVTGMKLSIKAKGPGIPRFYSAQFRTGAGPTLGASKSFAAGPGGPFWSIQPNPNSETDTWGLTLIGTDVDSANFGVRLTIPSASGQLAIDQVVIRLYTSNIPTIGPAYPIVAVQEGNVLVIQSANTPPPTSGTGDIIDGALVVDNVANRRVLSYSLPGKYDYFPAIYSMGLDLKEFDAVMVVRRVGDVGLALCRHKVVRINYVPYSTDPDFTQGRAYEEIVPDHGCASRQGAVTFQMPDGPTMVAYVSNNGIYINDGGRDHIVSRDIKWETTVDVTKLDKAVLLNYPKEYVLKFEYISTGSGATENNRYLLLHYHPSHQKPNRQFKITGPCGHHASCGALAKLTNEHVLLTGHNSNGRIYVEDNGVSDGQNADQSAAVTTGAGGGDWSNVGGAGSFTAALGDSSDTTYARWSDDGVSATALSGDFVNLNTLVDPGVDTGFKLRFRVRSSLIATGATMHVTIRKQSGGTVVKEFVVGFNGNTFSPVDQQAALAFPVIVTDYEIPFSAVEAAIFDFAQAPTYNILFSGSHTLSATFDIAEMRIMIPALATDGTGINQLWETGEIYPAGPGNGCTVKRAWVHQNGGGSAMTATFKPRYRNESSALVDHTSETFAPNPEGLILLQSHVGVVEAVRYQCSIPDAGTNNAAISFNYVLHDVDEHGKALDT